MGTWATEVEQRTLKTADNHKEIWDVEDLEFVAAFAADSTDEELALTLGRSLYAIQSIKKVLDERINREVAARRTEARATERGYTFIDGDYPPGWND